MALDRDATLKKAEKLLKQGRLELAIAEYVRVVEESPRDWSIANTLGELYARAGKPQQAVGQYTRIAEHYVDEGFYPKAAALYRKILKLVPEDEATQIQLADISARQGLLADAKSHLNAVAARRRAKGDRRGAAEIVVRLGTIDPADFDARLAAARTLEEMGEEVEAGTRFKAVYDDLLEKGRTAEAVDALKAFARINPADRDARSTLAREALDRGDVAGAREFLDEDSAGEDPALLLSLAEVALRSGEVARAKVLLDRLIAADPDRRWSVGLLGWSFADSSPEATFACIDAAVNGAVAVSEFREAATVLQDFVARVPGQIPALLRLVEVSVDGGLEQEMNEAQVLLTDAYLAAKQPAEARVIAEDLIARQPWEPAHIDRFRRALVMMRVSDPDSLIAERLSGQSPFTARDRFFDGPDLTPATSAADSGDGQAEPSESAEITAPVASHAGVASHADTDPAAGADTDAGDAGTDADAKAGAQDLPLTPMDAASGDEIDLTDALGGFDVPTRDESGAEAPEAEAAGKLDEAFARIRTDAEADPDFSDQHMTLARTYIEIGMLDEALDSLQTAVRSPRHRFEAAAALGRLYVRRGEPTQAIDWLERAAEAPAPTADAGRELLYDLGVLLDDAAETSRALAVFLELQSDAGDYRDVPARIDRLSRVQTGG